MGNKADWIEKSYKGILIDPKRKYKEIEWALSCYQDPNNGFNKQDFKWYVKMLFENGKVFISDDAFQLISAQGCNGLFTESEIDELENGTYTYTYNPSSTSSSTYLQKKVHGHAKRTNQNMSLVWEHVVPTDVIIEEFLQNQSKQKYQKYINLLKYGVVCIVTKDEDNKLNKKGLRCKMPKDQALSPTNMWDRYKSAGISVKVVPVP